LSEGRLLNYTRADGTPFANTGDCVSCAAHGGVLKPVVVKTNPTISTTLFRSSIPAGSTTPTRRRCRVRRPTPAGS
jgi:hypothetical protein